MQDVRGDLLGGRTHEIWRAWNWANIKSPRPLNCPHIEYPRTARRCVECGISGGTSVLSIRK